MQYTQVKINKRRLQRLKDISDQAKQSIDAIKYEHPTVTLAMNFHKPAGEANLYVRFGYGTQKVL